MGRRIPDSKVEEMWTHYQQRQSVRFVAQKCKVSHLTVRRYREKENWNGRLEGIRRRTRYRLDGEDVDFRVRQGMQAREIQDQALARILNEGFRNAKDAVDAYFKATAEERILREMPSDRDRLFFLEQLQARYAEQQQDNWESERKETERTSE